MAFNLDRIADNLRRFGVKVVEVDGWQYRGYAQQDLIAYRGTLNHHTATNRAAFARSVVPTLGLLINGRSDLPGPLCNLAGARDGTIYVVATGVANHAGMGVAPGIPDNTGNHYFCGIEWESSGTYPYDWTVEQLAVMPLVNAALELSYMQNLSPDEHLCLSHAEYSTVGKIDIAGYPGGMDRLRSQTNDIIAQLAGGSSPIQPAAPNKGFLMSLTDAQQQRILQAAEVLVGHDTTLNKRFVGGSGKRNLSALVSDIGGQVASMPRSVWSFSGEEAGKGPRTIWRRLIDAATDSAEAKTASRTAATSTNQIDKKLAELAQAGVDPEIIQVALTTAISSALAELANNLTDTKVGK